MSEQLISPQATIGANVQIGELTRVYPNVVIGDNTTVDTHCVIGHPAQGRWTGHPVRVGAGSVLRSHTVMYEGSEFGPRLETGHHTLLREGIQAGENLRVGSFSDLEGDCVIGDFARFHSYVHVARGSKIGHFVWLFSLTTLTNDPLPPCDFAAPVTIEDGVVVCVGNTVLPGTILRRGCFITAGSMAKGEIPEGAVVTGNPGRVSFHVSNLMNPQVGLQHPWMNHFRSGYPAHAQERLDALRDAIMAGRGRFRRLQKVTGIA
jgi:acetyltransferase-like isoleucine patch superfamily enzyme